MTAFTLPVALLVTIAVLPATFAARSNEECDVQFPRCIANFNSQTFNSDRSVYCALGKGAMSCVRRLDCESQMYVRMAYRQVERVVYNNGQMPCDLGPFLVDFPLICTTSRDLRRCMTTYTDRLNIHTQGITRDQPRVCEDLNDYVACQLAWDGSACNVTRDTMRTFANEEKVRMGLTSECEISPLNAATAQGASIMAIATTMLLSLSRPV